MGPLLAAQASQPGRLAVGNAGEAEPTMAGLAVLALQTISGEQAAQGYLQRLREQIAEPDELAALIATQRDAVALVGFARVLEKALLAKAVRA